jgi:hypothetical protein
VIFALLLVIVSRGESIAEFINNLTEDGLRAGLIMTYIGKSKRLFHSEA